MRILCLAFVAALAWPAPALAQHSFSLPSIGLPLPPIGLPPASSGPARTPWWERQPPPPWEPRRDARPPDRPHYPYRPYPFFPQVLYVTEPYVIAVPQPPQIIVVQQPPEIRVVEIEVPAPEPPYVPTGDRTVYMIPGCYVGNVPPKDVKLPERCDVSKVVTFTP